MPNHSCIAYVGEDVFEIIYNATTVVSIIRYRHGLNVRGEEVDFDVQPHYIQVALFNRLRREIVRLRALAEEQAENLDERN